MSEHAVYVEFGGSKHRVGTAYQQQDGGFTLVLGGTLSLGPGQASTSRGGAPSATGGAVFPPFGRKKGQPIVGCDLENLEWYRGAIQRSVDDPARANFREKNQAVLDAIEAEIARQGGSVPERQQASWGDNPTDDTDSIPFDGPSGAQ